VLVSTWSRECPPTGPRRSRWSALPRSWRCEPRRVARAWRGFSPADVDQPPRRTLAAVADVGRGVEVSPNTYCPPADEAPIGGSTGLDPLARHHRRKGFLNVNWRPARRRTVAGSTPKSAGSGSRTAWSRSGTYRSRGPEEQPSATSATLVLERICRSPRVNGSR